MCFSLNKGDKSVLTSVFRIKSVTSPNRFRSSVSRCPNNAFSFLPLTMPLFATLLELGNYKEKTDPFHVSAVATPAAVASAHVSTTTIWANQRCNIGDPPATITTVITGKPYTCQGVCSKTSPGWPFPYKYTCTTAWKLKK